ncbi:Tail completion protein [uncultured Caudovirales phage]|uniref:Tail completion protein n=1 Tax=uncultured Caudovirales phage TaxID=2100421 RepID=A0A6J5M687_9CAUD|nr:Tail completion protein [uncultured Caudovirales phage]
MLNPNIEIKKWFYTNLTSATALVVYDGFAPEGAGNEYIVLTGRTSTQDQGKEGYTNTISIDVDIITKNANFGYKRAETISDLVLTAINSDTNITLANGFTASSLSVESVRNLDGLNPLDNVFRVLITYNIIITQI